MCVFGVGCMHLGFSFSELICQIVTQLCCMHCMHTFQDQHKSIEGSSALVCNQVRWNMICVLYLLLTHMYICMRVWLGRNCSMYVHVVCILAYMNHFSSNYIIIWIAHSVVVLIPYTVRTPVQSITTLLRPSVHYCICRSVIMSCMYALLFTVHQYSSQHNVCMDFCLQFISSCHSIMYVCTFLWTRDCHIVTPAGGEGGS